MENTKFYSVGINESWTVEPATIEEMENQGFEVKESRTVGDFQQFLNGQMVGWMFFNQNAQRSFLRQKGLI